LNQRRTILQNHTSCSRLEHLVGFVSLSQIVDKCCCHQNGSVLAQVRLLS